MAECNFPMIAVRMPMDGFNVAVIPFWPDNPRGVASPYRPLSDHILAVFHVELALPWRVAVLYMVEPGRHSRNPHRTGCRDLGSWHRWPIAFAPPCFTCN